MIRMSKSSVDAYLFCPYNLFLNKIKGFRDHQSDPLEGSPLKKGSELHKIFEDYYDDPRAKEIRNEDEMRELLFSHPLTQKGKLEVVDPDHDNLDSKYSCYHDLEKEYRKHLENFTSFNVAVIRERGFDNYIPEYRELELYNKKEHFLGYIDRAEKLEDGTYRILDYKTGRPKTLRNYLVELGLYKWLFETEMGKPVGEVGIYFSEPGLLRSTKLTKEDVQRALGVLGTVKFLMGKNIFPRHRKYSCDKFCENWDICDVDLYEDEIESELPAEYFNLVE
jgi:CRISPR/Cas system-associated exonuclease Cas4 (RecB family)